MLIKEVTDLILSSDSYELVMNSDVYIFSTQFKLKVGDDIFNKVVKNIAENAASKGDQEAA